MESLLADAPNVGAFQTGIRILNPSEAKAKFTLIVIGNGKRQNIELEVNGFADLSFMLSKYVPVPGAYGVAILGPVTGVAQHSQGGNFYNSISIPQWK